MPATPPAFVFGAQPPSEMQLKCFILEELRASDRRWSDAVISNEFRIGDTAVRADLAVLGQEFVGIEIKSERDSLSRLSRQMHVYKAYFDRVILAVAPCHLRNLDWAQLREVDVWQVGEAGRVQVVSERSRLPETLNHIDLLTLAESRRLPSGATPDDVQLAFFDAFKRRYGKTSKRFWTDTSGRKITPKDIGDLSPFQEQRKSAETWTLAQQEAWSDWDASLRSLAGA